MHGKEQRRRQKQTSVEVKNFSKIRDGRRDRIMIAVGI